MKIRKSILKKIIKEEILRELLIEAKVKVSSDLLEPIRQMYLEDEESLQALDKLKKRHDEKLNRPRTKAVILWLVENYIKKAERGEEREKTPPSKSIEIVTRFFNQVKIVRRKYQDNNRYKRIIDELTGGKKINGDPLHINLFSVDDIKKSIENLSVLDGEFVRDAAQARKDKIGETKNWNVYMPSSLESSCEIGKETEWCTSATKGNNPFYSHWIGDPKGNKILFFIINKNSKKEGDPDWSPMDFVSLSYFSDGSKDEDYSDDGGNVRGDGRGIRSMESFEDNIIKSKEEVKQIYQIIGKKLALLKKESGAFEHPAIPKLRKALKDPEMFKSLFGVNQSYKQIMSTVKMLSKFGKMSPAVKELKDQLVKNKVLHVIQRGDLENEKVQLNNMNLNKADFSPKEGAYGTVYLNNSNFKGSSLLEANFTSTSLGQTNFQKAVLRGANFTSADMSETNFLEADLRGAIFDKSSVYFPNFQKADLRGAIFDKASNFRVDPEGVRGAVYDSTTKFPQKFNPEDERYEMIKK